MAQSLAITPCFLFRYGDILPKKINFMHRHFSTGIISPNFSLHLFSRHNVWYVTHFDMHNCDMIRVTLFKWNMTKVQIDLTVLSFVCVNTFLLHLREELGLLVLGVSESKGGPARDASIRAQWWRSWAGRGWGGVEQQEVEELNRRSWAAGGGGVEQEELSSRRWRSWTGGVEQNCWHGGDSNTEVFMYILTCSQIDGGMICMFW